ncbi:Band 3 cytoplasmic domain [Trinorchestia longiramus]|nr:Band 3 cytoplasmic domain [Trinorchestia longiramus]
MSRKDERSLLSSSVEEAPRDPGIAAHHTSNAEDYEGHRAHSVYVGYQLPSSMQHRKRSRHRHHRHHHHHKQPNNKANEGPMEDPSTRVQFLIGEEQDDGSMHAVHPIFSEMETLVTVDGQYQWKETARWVKFEEDVEEGGERWSKPHVATLSLHALFELRSFLMKGVVLLDMDAQMLDQIAEIAIEALVNKKQLEEENKELLKDVIMRRHKHLYERSGKDKSMSNLPLIRSLAEIGRNHSSSRIHELMDLFSGVRHSFHGGHHDDEDPDHHESAADHPDHPLDVGPTFGNLLTVPGAALPPKDPPGPKPGGGGCPHLLVFTTSFIASPPLLCAAMGVPRTAVCWAKALKICIKFLVKGAWRSEPRLKEL